MSTKCFDAKSFAAFVERTEVFLFDCDGVLWRGSQIIPGAIQFLRHLRSAGKRVYFVSNNSTKTRATYVHKLTALGIEAKEDEIWSSAYADENQVFVYGEEGLMDELALNGVVVDENSRRLARPAAWSDVPAAADVNPHTKAVLAGFNLHMNYSSLSYAYHCITQKQCAFVATNTDRTFPSERGIFPGGGTMVNNIAHAVGREPDVVCGKPNTTMLEALVARDSLDKSKMCIIGDRLETDILFGNNGNIQTILVLSGVSTQETLDALTEEQTNLKPMYVANSVTDFAAWCAAGEK